MNSSGEFRKKFSKFLKKFEVVSRKFLRIKKMQEIGEQLDSSILTYAILLQLMHCSIASCILHIACCMLCWCKIK